MTEPTKEQIDDHERWMLVALVLGWNALAARADNLGEKVYFRLARDQAEKSAIEKGAQIELKRDERVLTLPYPAEIVFTAADIELMRACVAKHDARDDAEPEVPELRPEVVAFAKLMEQELRANDHKGGWQDDDVRDLARRLGEEADELQQAVRDFEGATRITRETKRALVASEAADVANFAMFIVDVCGALK